MLLRSVSRIPYPLCVFFKRVNASHEYLFTRAFFLWVISCAFFLKTTLCSFSCVFLLQVKRYSCEAKATGIPFVRSIFVRFSFARKRYEATGKCFARVSLVRSVSLVRFSFASEKILVRKEYPFRTKSYIAWSLEKTHEKVRVSFSCEPFTRTFSCEKSTF